MSADNKCERVLDNVFKKLKEIMYGDESKTTMPEPTARFYSGTYIPIASINNYNCCVSGHRLFLLEQRL